MTSNHLDMCFGHLLRDLCNTFFFNFPRFRGFYAIKMDLGPHQEIGNRLFRHDKHIYFAHFQVYHIIQEKRKKVSGPQLVATSHVTSLRLHSESPNNQNMQSHYEFIYSSPTCNTPRHVSDSLVTEPSPRIPPSFTNSHTKSSSHHRSLVTSFLRIHQPLLIEPITC